MAEQADDIKNPLDGCYLIDKDATYTAPTPSPLDNLLSMYGLEPIAASLARTKSDGTKGVKLRKSYKNHISDLPGTHQIPAPKQLNGQLLDPELAKQPDVIKQFDSDMLSVALKFDRTPIHGIPGFVSADLAISPQAGSARDDSAELDEYKRKRKRKQSPGGDIKRQHL